MIEQLYRSLYRIRRVEEAIARVYPSRKIMSPVHLSIGQEAVSVGVCEALEPRTTWFSAPTAAMRLYLAKGGDLKEMMAELYGKATGWRGQGRLDAPDRRRRRHDGRVGCRRHHHPPGCRLRLCACVAGQGEPRGHFFGEGATEEGVFHESLNFAALKEAADPVCLRKQPLRHPLAPEPIVDAGTSICDRVADPRNPARRSKMTGWTL